MSEAHEAHRTSPFEPAEPALRVKGRASPPLLFGLAPRGVCRASRVATRAVGSYPTVSPLPSATGLRRTCRRFSCGLSSKHESHRRFIFCGTLREQSREHRPKPGLLTRSPGVTRRVAQRSRRLRRKLRCPDFPPATGLSAQQPAIVRPARQYPLYARAHCVAHSAGWWTPQAPASAQGGDPPVARSSSVFGGQ